MKGPGVFHKGELEVQRRAGVMVEAARLSGMLTSSGISPGMRQFLLQQSFVAVTAHDRAGRQWTSSLTGVPGFIDTDGSTVFLSSAPVEGDPLFGISPGSSVGMVVVDFAGRRRLRVNGRLVAASPGFLAVTVEQAYGNCPRYIQGRSLEHVAMPVVEESERRSHLDSRDIHMIREADTFFLGTNHPERGMDSSHRGGAPGFVRVDRGGLWWPDYPGNNLFNSLGNIVVDHTASLLFLDFSRSVVTHLSGWAKLEWLSDGTGDDESGTGRRVYFSVSCVVRRTASVVAGAVEPSRFNPRMASRRSGPVGSVGPVEAQAL